VKERTAPLISLKELPPRPASNTTGMTTNYMAPGAKQRIETKKIKRNSKTSLETRKRVRRSTNNSSRSNRNLLKLIG
jgi:hypothetical protein